MSDTITRAEPTEQQTTEHFDIIIVGAGISGVGGAYHLQEQYPEKTFLVLEGLESFGGTWLMHKYPGVRSDSDLYTFGYRFKPWTSAPIASAGEILKYMGEVIDENDLARHIRYHHRISAAAWSSADNLWTLTATNSETGETSRFTCNFLWMCQGYYRHSEGYTPEWPGMDRFQGRIVHPQTWPDDLDLTGKKVICIGSGATTATVVPAIAGQCEHVTVLQRSPTYFWTGRNANELADTLRELEIDETWIHEIVRRKVLHDQQMVTQLAFDEPEMIKTELLNIVRSLLPEGYDVDKHFTPKYRPWQQRLAFVPDGDLFAGISAGKASMVTDEIDTFTETGIRTKSGEELEADVILTATGFNLSVLGDIEFTLDGTPLNLADTVTYRGMMFTGVPNLLWVFGYFRASWTLRADLISDLVCRLLHHMDELGAQRVTPALRSQDADMAIGPWMDPSNFNPNYLMRSMHLLPKAGNKPEWRHTQDYWYEKEALPAADLDDGCLVYE
ncbi:MAG TPA: NAD(P)/FAD-dependent oxidoreductase [Ilumatobacteraceae bacterium]|nr:NAD(P)/FAD-dependent oxidoreductase [Ilumatobacteraceae bacterium]